MSRTFVIMLAGGSGTRMGASVNKVYLPLLGVPCLRRSIQAFRGLADHMVLVCRPQEKSRALREAELAGVDFPVTAADGGDTRQQSVLNGLHACSFEKEDLVLVHDGARCLVTQDVIRQVLSSCRTYGSGVAAVPLTDTVKRAGPDGVVSDTPESAGMMVIQTPQGFRAADLLEAEEKALREGFIGTDDASVMEHYGRSVHLTPGARQNLKLTTKEDLQMAESILRQHSLPALRVGQGYDVHRLVPDRRLILCGVEIPHTLGLLGHSDADVALHALMDAMLGAAALGDIGRHFPDTDPRYSGISSMLLLEHTVTLLREQGFVLSNADVTIVAQRPKLLPFISQMRENIARVCGVPEACISVKATTTEGVGFEGKMEGISAQAVCLLSAAV